MPSFFELQKFAATGIASPEMTYFDKMRALSMAGGTVRTLTGIPPLSFKANGTPLISWSMLGNGQQTGTPSPDNIIMPTFCGVRTGNLWDEGYTGISTSIKYVPVYVGAETVTISTSCQRTPGGSCLFILPGNVSSGAATNANGVWADSGSYVAITRTVQAVNGYVTIAFRYLYDGDDEITPEDADTMLNVGDTAIPYEPYGYKSPFTCAGQTTPVYLGQTQTVRRVKKLVLTGEEIGVNKRTSPENSYSISIDRNGWPVSTAGYGISSHFVRNGTVANLIDGEFYVGSTAFSFRLNDCTDAAAFRTYLAAQYAAGTPVTVWYVLAEPETAIVNEPLAKIGDYADELSSTDAGVSIPTVKGDNTLTVDTDLQPSSVTIRYKK